MTLPSLRSRPILTDHAGRYYWAWYDSDRHQWIGVSTAPDGGFEVGSARHVFSNATLSWWRLKDAVDYIAEREGVDRADVETP